MKVVRLRKFTIIEKLFFEGIVSDLLPSLKIKSYLKTICLGFKKKKTGKFRAIGKKSIKNIILCLSTIRSK